eukprot:scaffold1317_cov348-Prasinococcus_capsulatus_cf.AAC.6
MRPPRRVGGGARSARRSDRALAPPPLPPPAPCLAARARRASAAHPSISISISISGARGAGEEEEEEPVVMDAASMRAPKVRAGALLDAARALACCGTPDAEQ